MKLIIYNNKGSHSTVLNAFLNVAADCFEEIFVLFPTDYVKDGYAHSENVHYSKPSKPAYFKALIASIFDMLSVYSFKDFKAARARGKFSVKYIIKYAKTLFISNALYCSSSDILKENKGNVAVFSTWYAENAIAAAKAKKDFPQITAMSYAHSYEVDFRKNLYPAILRDLFKEEFLDKILFISENVMNEYIDLNKNHLKCTDKYIPLHFGSAKKYDCLSKPSDDGVFRLFSCSGISPVKRLDIICEALKLYEGNVLISWTHLGSGSDEAKIKETVKALEGKSNVSVNLAGRVSNEDVHKYYAENAIDLFINVSASEGLPVSIMEAMSYGVPAIATDVGGNSEIVTENTGYILPAELSANLLCEKLTAIVNNPDLNSEKRAFAYQMWSDGYRIDKNVKELIDLFHEN